MKLEHPKYDLAKAGLYVCDTSIVKNIPKDKPVVDSVHDVLPRHAGQMLGFPRNSYPAFFTGVWARQRRMLTCKNLRLCHEGFSRTH